MKNFIWILIIIVFLGGAYYWYSGKNMSAPAQTASTASTTAASDLGTYSYECDEHVAFTMTPASDMQTIAIAPNGATATFPPTATLQKQTATSGVKYVGGGVVFTAHGETVTLGEGESAINCSPLQNSDMAPFNFGD